MGMKMTSWFDIKTLDRPTTWSIEEMQENVNQVEIMESVDIITDLLNKEVDKLGETNKVFIGGFSQGCSISLASFLLFNGG